MICRVCKQERERSKPLADVCQGCVDLAQAARGAGEQAARVTKLLGLNECGGCSKRRAAMNLVNLSGTPLEVFKGLAQAILNPEKEDKDD